MKPGTITRVNGPVVEVEGLDAAMLDFVEVGDARLPGEVIALDGRIATVKVYEYTGGVRPGEPVQTSGHPLVAELGPGLIGNVFDGMLRRLTGAGARLSPTAMRETLPRDRSFAFTPRAKAGTVVGPGTLLGSGPETVAVEFRALVPPGVEGTLAWLADEGEYGVDATIARVGDAELTLAQTWPVRRRRPFQERLPSKEPLVLGQRVLDLLYPIARGSSAAVLGGFGTGKTVLLQQVAKWCAADVIVYVGCGERGNELVDVLDGLSSLVDPRTGDSLLDRTVLVANTSNMPVLAREASIYTGVTVAEFYRDMGYDTVLIADSTSRWAEALREVAARTGELPAEEGYPARLASALADFYERSGNVRTLSGAEASVTILGAVSPPGGDMAEPVSAHTRRFVRCIWSLDPDLAYARHYPAVSWRDSSSRDAEILGAWSDRHDPDASGRRQQALSLLADADRLESVAELVGSASLPDRERVVLLGGRLLREGVLQQSTLSVNDTYCAPEKQTALLELALKVHARCLELVEQGVAASAIEQVDLSAVTRARDEWAPGDAAGVRTALARALAALEGLG